MGPESEGVYENTFLGLDLATEVLEEGAHPERVARPRDGGDEAAVLDELIGADLLVVATSKLDLRLARWARAASTEENLLGIAAEPAGGDAPK